MKQDQNILPADELKEHALQEAIERVLKWSRELSACDVVGDFDSVFRTLQHIAQGLTGLKSALENYDKTVAFFAEKENKEQQG